MCQDGYRLAFFSPITFPPYALFSYTLKLRLLNVPTRTARPAYREGVREVDHPVCMMSRHHVSHVPQRKIKRSMPSARSTRRHPPDGPGSIYSHRAVSPQVHGRGRRRVMSDCSDGYSVSSEGGTPAMIASASISTSIAGSTNADTSTIVAAGRMSPKTSA